MKELAQITLPKDFVDFIEKTKKDIFTIKLSRDEFSLILLSMTFNDMHLKSAFDSKLQDLLKIRTSKTKIEDHPEIETLLLESSKIRDKIEKILYGKWYETIKNS